MMDILYLDLSLVLPYKADWRIIGCYHFCNSLTNIVNNMQILHAKVQT